jgi:multidrug resistance efflux pump
MDRAPAATSLLVLALGAGLAGGACSSGVTGELAEAAHEAGIRRGDLEDRFLLTGELRAVRSRPLTTPYTRSWNVSIQWLAPEGSLVRTGDAVVEFDTSAVTGTLEDKRLQAAEAEKQLEQLRIDHEVQRQEKNVDLRRKEIARDRAALEAAIPESFQSRRDHQEKQLARERAEADLQKARADLETFEKGAEAQVRVQELNLGKARRDLERAEASLAELTLRAPADGVLLHGSHPWEGRKWQVGDNTWAGLTVAEIPDLSEMEVVAWLGDVDDGQVAAGMPARAVLDTYPDRSFPGRVVEVAEVAEEPERGASRRFFRVRVSLDRIDPGLARPGMSAKVEVIRRRWEDAPLAPRESLDLEAEPPRLHLASGEAVAVALLGCSAVDCALSQAPPEGTRLGRAR